MNRILIHHWLIINATVEPDRIVVTSYWRHLRVVDLPCHVITAQITIANDPLYATTLIAIVLILILDEEKNASNNNNGKYNTPSPYPGSVAARRSLVPPFLLGSRCCMRGWGLNWLARLSRL